MHRCLETRQNPRNRRLRDGQVYDEAGRFVLADGRVEMQ